MNKPARASLRWLNRMIGQNAVLLVVLAVTPLARADHRPGSFADRVARSAQAQIPVTINWKMADRFGPGYDLNRNGRPDLPNSYEYVNPGRYEVGLEARIDTSGASSEGMSYRWTIAGPAGSSELVATGPKTIARLPQGDHFVSVTIRLGDGRTARASEMIRVRDVLVVAMGDSLATGEGNPEEPARWDGIKSSERGSVLRGRVDPSTPAVWADGGPDGSQSRTTPTGTLPPANVLHSRAHRSTRSGPAQFAMRLEAEDPHTSVTFVCLAATGARTDDLFQSDGSDHNKALGPGPPLPAQLDELHAIAGTRAVDILILSIGCNDARGIDLVGELLRREIRYIDPLRLLAAYPTRHANSAAAASDLDSLVEATAARTLAKLSPEARRKEIDPDVKLIYDVSEAIESGIESAREQLDRVGRAVANDPVLAGASVHLLGYPDLTRESSGATAAAILDDLVPGLRLNRRELDLARERLLRPLHKTLSDAASRHGWTFTDGLFESFGAHGYAAEDTWFVRAKESEQIQGPRLTAVGYLRGEIAPGMLHPNERGHRAIADHLLRNHTRATAANASRTREMSLRFLERPR
jgi:lysophospholipase L1-like esterase